MRATDTLDRFLAHLRRRTVAGLVLEHSSLSLAALMAGLVLLLVLGTQILDWYWLAGLAVLSVGFTALRVAKNLPTLYELAQRVDHRLGLRDTLSTALFFSRPEGARRDVAGMRAAQRELAEGCLASADPKLAAPIRLPRGWWVAFALTVVALGLAAARYGRYNALALRAPLAPGIADLLERIEKPSRLAKAKRPERKPAPWEDSAVAIAPQPAEGSDGQMQTLAPADSHDNEPGSQTRPVEAKDSATVEKIRLQGQGSEEATDEEGTESGQRSGAGQGNQPGNEGAPAPHPGQERRQPPPNNAPQSEQSGANSSLMSKMRDAMTNLLSKLTRQQPASGDQQPGGAGEKSGRQDGQQAKQKGKPAPGQQQAKDGSGMEMQGENQGQANQTAQNGAGKGNRPQDANRGGSPESKSGIGREDGDKDLRAAEQAAAMGKISEILGRRSQNVTGDVTVEVNSGHQQLRTAYSRMSTAHTEAAGEIHRDEVPLALQSYVQQYFEEVRKSAPKPAKP